MDIQGQSSVLSQDLWRGFCLFIHHSYCNEIEQECSYNLHNGHLSCQMPSLSLLLTVGGQDTSQLLQENGLSEVDTVRFKSILSKVEELSLFKLVLDYEKYKQLLDTSKIDNTANEVTNVGVTSLTTTGNQKTFHQNSHTMDILPIEEIQTFKVVVTGESPAIHTELKKEERSSVDANVERLNSGGDSIEFATNEDNVTNSQGNGSLNSAKTKSVQKDSKEGYVTNKESEDLLTVRRSSRQIRVSSKYAENKNAIQNLLKPEIVTTNDQQANSISEPPCLCSICKKTFRDSKSLTKHWKYHKQNKKDKPDLPFLCQVCEVKHATHAQMKEHFKSHTRCKGKHQEKHDEAKECLVSTSSDTDKDVNVLAINKNDENEVEKLKNSAGTDDKLSTCINSSQDSENHKSSCADEKDSESFRCQQCSQLFEDQASLLNHKINHLDGALIKSKKGQPLKQQKFTNNAGKRLYRRMGLFKCKHCTKSFKYERQLDFHMTLHTGEKPHICEVCGQGFRIKRSLLNHRRFHDEMCHMKCEFCPKTFVDKKALESHQLVHSGVKPFSCEACGKGFRRMLGLKNHQRLHKKDEAIKCDECDKTFVDKWGMLKHKSIHSGEKPFVCTECGKMFRLKKGLQDHVKLHDKDTQLQCHLCPRTFIEKRKLDIHLMAHKGEKPFICDKCGKGFMNSVNLKVHNRCHTGEKPYKCSFCDRTFNQQGSLIAHERHHKGERPYVCDICGDGYITKSQLTIHKRKHSNERPYQCDQCDYAAYTGSLLKIHKIKHSDEKPFKCPVCPSAFKRQHHLEVHSKTHLNNVVKETTQIIDIVIHKCPYCNECFGSEESLTSHIGTHEIVVVTETTANAGDDIFVDHGSDEVAYNIVLL